MKRYWRGAFHDDRYFDDRDWRDYAADRAATENADRLRFANAPKAQRRDELAALDDVLIDADMQRIDQGLQG